MHDSISRWLEHVGSLFDTSFSDLRFLEPNGPKLHITVPPKEYISLRLELADTQFLHLHSIEVVDGRGELVQLTQARIIASSHYGESANRVREQALFDANHPHNYGVHTERDTGPWVEIIFPVATIITEILIRNRQRGPTSRAAGLLVCGSIDGKHWNMLYDGGARIDVFQQRVEATPLDISGDAKSAITEVVTDVFVGNYKRARSRFFADMFPEEYRDAVRSALNASVLARRELEWTTHGAQRSFRFWRKKEKAAYVQLASSVIEDLRSLSDDVCFGFGSVLGMVRDGDLIDHDDDMDIIIAFEQSQASTLASARAITKKHLEDRGYIVEGKFFAHWHVRKKTQKVDVFVGLYDADMNIGWYPSKRGNLARCDIFPPRTIDLYGVACRLPVNTEVYLSAIYGPNWCSKNPGWEHPWDRNSYADIA